MKKLIALSLSILLIVAMTACGAQSEKDPSTSSGNQEPSQSDGQQPSNDNSSDIGSPNDDTTSNEGSEPAAKTALVYFGDSQAMYLVGEEREFDQITPEALIQALIDGPQNEENSKTIPDGTKLLDIKVENGIAYVNFSKELKDNHWGGSTGESFTIYSIVNTLALNSNLDIEKVQILIDGNAIETLAGHFEIMEPLSPDLGMSKLQ